MRIQVFGCLLLVGIATLVGCGNPTVTLPAALVVVHMPLDGAINVEPDAEVAIYFSGDVDPDSIGTDTILLETAVWDDLTKCSEWTALGWLSVVDAEQARKVRVGSDQDALGLGACFRLVCTTGVRGTELGPLVDLGMPGRPGIGDEAAFFTRQ